jgi:hypothetical protein
MPTANMVQIDSHALATLRYIRKSMDAATSVAVPGSSGIAMGCVGLAATALSFIPRTQQHWILIWLLAAVVAAGLGGALLIRPSSLRGSTPLDVHFRKFALCLFPSLFAGLVLTAVLWYYGQQRALPGMWLLLYGCGLMTVSIVTVARVAVMGGLFMALGLLAFFVPMSYQLFLLGLGFGGLHIVFGILIGRTTHESEA